MTKQNSDVVFLSELSVEGGRSWILKHCGDLPVATHKKVGDLNQHAFRLTEAPTDAVFLIAGHYLPAYRNGASWAATPLLVFEFDDSQKPKGTAEIFEAAQRDAGRSAALMAALMGKPTELVLPNVVVYSGGKSFHCMFFLDPWISNPDDLALVRRSAEIFRKRAATTAEKDRQPRHHAALNFDSSVFASRTAIVRLPSHSAERVYPPKLNRLSQPCWATLNNAALNSRELISMSRIRCAEDDVEKARPKFTCTLRKRDLRPRSRFQPLDLSQSQIESVIGPVSCAADGIRMRCRCPIHDDKNPSAFVKSNGFIYCSVCCPFGEAWTARIIRNANESLEVVRNEK